MAERPIISFSAPTPSAKSESRRGFSLIQYPPHLIEERGEG